MSQRYDELVEQSLEEQIEARLSNTIMDNSMMCAVMPNNTAVTNLILNTILMEPITVTSVTTQERRYGEKKTVDGKETKEKDIVFDVLAKDGQENEFDIEFQKVTTTNQLYHRLAYYGYFLYKDSVDENDRYHRLKHRSAVIFLIAGHHSKKGPFISEESYEEKRKGVIHHKPYGINPEVYIVYMEETDPGTDIGKLAHDLLCNDPNEIHNKKIADVVHSYQETWRVKDMSFTKKDRDLMKHTREMFYNGGKEDGIEEGKKIGVEQGKKIGIEQGKKKASIDIAKNLIDKGMDDETVASVTDLTIEEVKQLHERFE